jgi:hypothetical protein
MDNPIEEYFRKVNSDRDKRILEHEKEVLQSNEFKACAKHCSAITRSFINALRSVSLYSTRAKSLYEKFLLIRAIDDLIQSSLGVQSLVMDGVHNMAKREIRYLIELSAKYLVIDQENMDQDLGSKLKYLDTDIPRSSIDVVSRMKTPFDPATDLEFKNDISDLFYKSCAYVHPSRKQLEAQLDSYDKGNYIGFESVKQLEEIVRVIFRAYDMILVNVLMDFGHSMSADLFENVFDVTDDFRIGKGKYMKKYSELFDNRRE